MGFFNWGRSSGAKPADKPSESTGSDAQGSTELQISKEVSDYLNKEESATSDRDFKRMLKQQDSPKAVADVVEEEDVTPTDDARTQQLEHEIQEAKTKSKTAGQQQQVPEFVSKYSVTDTDIYKRENPLSEAVLTNCSEIQSEFMKCLRRKSMVQKITSMASGKDECTALADFLNSCMSMQKMALVMYDYASLDKVEEFENAKRDCDKCFNDNFKNVQDIQDDDKYNQYTRELKEYREQFYTKYGK